MPANVFEVGEISEEYVYADTEETGIEGLGDIYITEDQKEELMNLNELANVLCADLKFVDMTNQLSHYNIPVSYTHLGLEREKLEAEYKDLMEQIHYLKGILADEKKLLGVIKEEIQVISDKYGDERRTHIGYDEFDISMEDLIPEEDVVITMTNLGYIKRMTMDNFRSQNRGGKGIKGMQTISDDYIEDLMMISTHNYLMFFTNTGKVYRLKAYEIPEASKTSRGTAIINLLSLQDVYKRQVISCRTRIFIHKMGIRCG